MSRPPIGNQPMTAAERKRRQREKYRTAVTTRNCSETHTPRRGPKQFTRSVMRHCVTINGRDTSVTVDLAFWVALHEIASERGQSVSRLLSSIDAERQQTNFSSVIRVFVLRHYRDQLAAKRLQTAPEGSQA